MWLKIIYYCLIPSKHMTDITRYRFCPIYALMRDDIDINVGAVILFMIKKMLYHHGHRYGFNGLLTRFLRSH